MFTYWFATPFLLKMVHENICIWRERESERERERESICVITVVPLHMYRYFVKKKKKGPRFKYLDMIVRIYLLQLKPNETLFHRNKESKSMLLLDILPIYAGLVQTTCFLKMSMC